MYLTYSAIKTNNYPQQDNSQNERQLRYLAYLATCQKYQWQIAEIQKYLPGWVPEFR
jgi:hypothetical protein